MDIEARVNEMQRQLEEMKEDFKDDISYLEGEIKELKDSCKTTNDKVIAQGEKIKTLEEMRRTINGIAVGTVIVIITAFINLVIK